MDTQVSTASFTDLLRLCEGGKHEIAWELCDSLPAGPERLLIEGAVLAISQPEEAKDRLSEAAIRLSGELADKANLWLACAYDSCGENAEARVIVDSVKPVSDQVKFIHAFSWAGIYRDNPKDALKMLDSVVHLLDEVENATWKGKYFNHRGVILRRLKDMDGAIIAYTEAGYWYEQADVLKFVGVSRNNLAGVLKDAERYADAHDAVDSAILIFDQLGETVFLAQAHEQKSQIYRAQYNFENAGKSAAQSVRLLENRAHREMLGRSLLSDAAAATGKQEYSRSLAQLDRAYKIGEYLSNQSLMFDVSRAQRDLADKLRDQSRRRLIEIAMQEGSARAAARKLGINHHAVNKAIKKFGIKRTPDSPKKRILNARKK